MMRKEIMEVLRAHAEHDSEGIKVEDVQRELMRRELEALVESGSLRHDINDQGIITYKIPMSAYVCRKCEHYHRGDSIAGKRHWKYRSSAGHN